MKNLAPTLVILALSGCNQPPAGGTLAISPEAPTSQDDLIAEIVQPITDDNDDVVTLRWAWFLHGNLEPAHTTSTVPATATRKGQVWRVEVTPNDGKVDGVMLFAEASVINSLPTAEVSLAPGNPLADQDLVATMTISDLDGDDTSASRITWTVDGTAVDLPGTKVDASQTKRGETWKIEVTPIDDEEEGETVSAEVVIANVKPVADSVVIAPSEAYEDSRLVATATGTDHDGDDLEWTYTWFVNGGEVKSGAQNWLDGGDFDKSEQVIVEATASDSFEDGNTVTSDALTILNSPPTLGGARLNPRSAKEASTVTCLPDVPGDVDGDTVTFSYSWTVNRRDVGVSKSTLNGDNFSKGQQVVCTITPNDGTDDGTPVTSGFIVVDNTAPSITAASISPGTPRTDATLTASASGEADVDGDSITLGTEWYVNSASVSKGSTLGGSAFKKGDKVEVALTPFDGEDHGKTVRSPAVTIANTPPVITSVVLRPNPAYTTTHITATTVATDLDSDKLTYTYTWYVNSVKQSGAGATLDSSKFSKGQKVHVIALASDGTDTTSKTSGSLVVSNSAPTTPSTPTLSPASPKASDDLTCKTTGSTDADKDTITYYYAWYRNGSLYGTYGTKATTYALADSHTGAGQTWYCRVRATDGVGTSAWSTNSSTVTIKGTSGGGGSRADSGITCNTIKIRSPSSKTGHYWIDPDGDTNHSDAKQVYCDMSAAGGGWTLLSWTNNAATRNGSYYWGVSYPGTNLCTGISCAHGSFLTATQTNELFDRSSEFAKSQNTSSISNYQPISSYTYAGRYMYGSLKGFRLDTGKVTCTASKDGFKTGTFASIKGASTHNGTKVYLNKGMRYGGFDNTSAYTLFNVGAPNAYCSGDGRMPGTWMGSWTSIQYGPVNISAGAHAIWVK